MKKRIIYSLLIVGVLVIASFDLNAQCAMCKATLESNMQSGEDALGKGINSGIIYIMFIPYILIATAGYFVYKHYKKEIAQS